MKSVIQMFLDYLHEHKWQGRIFVSSIGISIIIAVSKITSLLQICEHLTK